MRVREFYVCVVGSSRWYEGYVTDETPACVQELYLGHRSQERGVACMFWWDRLPPFALLGKGCPVGRRRMRYAGVEVDRQAVAYRREFRNTRQLRWHIESAA